MPETAIFAPDGKVRMIPENQVQAAIAAGGKQATKMQAPDKSLRWIPNDQVDAATKAGGLAIPGMPKPKIEMQPSYTQMAIENTPSGADPHNPGNMPEQIKQQMTPEDRKKAEAGLATTAVATAVPLDSVVGGIKAALPVGVMGAKQLFKWAEANPVKAYALWQVLKDVVPGSEKVKKAAELATK